MLGEVIGGFLTGAAQAYYARKSALPEINRGKLCKSLTSLRTVLLEISETGKKIGSLVSSSTFYERSHDASLGELIKLLENQRALLSSCSKYFQTVAKVLEIDNPKLAKMKIHLRGKADRIEIIYDLAGRSTIPKWASHGLEPWEDSELIESPRKLIGKLSFTGRPDKRDDQIREQDKDFEHLVAIIKPLTKFIQETCPAQYRL